MPCIQSIHQITATIKLISGLHIGAGKDKVEIGGLDLPIIKDPLTDAPYIPGSSLKGKMRSLLEIGVFMAKSAETAASISDGKPCGCGKKDCYICKIFGTYFNPKPDPELGPPRLLVRDSFLTKTWQEKFEKGCLPLEVKTENTIHRVTGTAEHPRTIERVPASVEFDMNLTLKIYEGDKAEEFINCIYQGLALIQMDSLGGNSSRGCGQVEFNILKKDGIIEDIDLSKMKFF